MKNVLSIVVLLGLLVSGCGTEATSTALEATPTQFQRYADVVLELQALPAKQGLSDDKFQVRISGCWKNPAGNDLSDLQKTFYCYVPLEFRLCNTVVLLAHQGGTAADREARLRGFDHCLVITGQSELAKIANLNEAYTNLFLDNGASLPEAVNGQLVGQFKPTLATEAFAELLAMILVDLATAAWESI